MSSRSLLKSPALQRVEVLSPVDLEVALPDTLADGLKVTLTTCLGLALEIVLLSILPVEASAVVGLIELRGRTLWSLGPLVGSSFWPGTMRSPPSDRIEHEVLDLDTHPCTDAADPCCFEGQGA